MGTVLQKLFPATANNDYRGSPVALYTLCVFGLMFTFRSLVHYLKDDSGVNSIASIMVFPGNPDPNNVIYMYSSLWGSQQLITLAILALVLWRYRTLIPFMYLMIIAETLMRLSMRWLHPLTPEFFERTPPGVTANLPILFIAGVMLLLSLRETNNPEAG